MKFFCGGEYSTLMNRSSSWLWKNSYTTTDHELPPAPDDLTIPKFLGFIVDDICDVSAGSQT